MATITKLQRPSGTVYKARVRLIGQDGETSRTFKTRTAAERWARKFEAAALEDRAGLIMEGQKHTLKDAIKRYRTEILPDHTATTRPTYAQRLDYWCAELGHLRLSDVTPAKIAGCRDELLTSKAPATVHGYLAVLASVLTTCVKRWHWVKESPMAHVDKPSVANGRTRFLSQDELSRLLEACRASESPDLYLAVVLAITTGARRGELLGLRWRDVDLVKDVLYLRVDNETTTKGGVRAVRIASQVKPILEARQAGYRRGKVADITGAALVFPSRVSTRQPVDLRTPFRTALRRAGIEGFRWHDLRHSAASFMAAHGASLVEIGAVLGHRSAQTTKRYAHLAEQAAHELVQGTADKVLGGME
ncbi:tyrosine-type recombinase/integrase [Allochromatium vinosum]|uniref:Integrase family protein n=1 Tax=Allochromatium vinosum (strain ATCC 17899 / DSM 180 / NBRC 103801 / NCIMB 10441 / D) TaxID=572477 RepID=D3RR09_ALLVD|nr:site-specific integrase [Allochromatium vinosum]ADC61837.1 integrase family protein [Allochromatium vinosum DSM 180]